MHLHGRSDLQLQVQQVVLEQLQADAWRVLQQACYLAGETQQQQAAVLLLPLLKHDRAEVAIAASVALRKLQSTDVSDEVLAFLSEISHSQKALSEKNSKLSETYSQQITQLVQYFGNTRNSEAESLLRLISSKGFLQANEARCAAIWALGMIFEDQSPSRLRRHLEGFVSDYSGMFAEATTVRRYAALALGMIRATESEAFLNRIHNRPEEDLNVIVVCRWSLQRLTGESFPSVAQPWYMPDDFFLAPLEYTLPENGLNQD